LSLRRKAFSSRSESRVSRKGKHPVNGDGERDCSSNVIANLTRQSIFFRRMMDARIKSGHEGRTLVAIMKTKNARSRLRAFRII
jgi:hypothetical protein